ncbi:MAG: AAA family ATPase, partial [Cyanobacteria bacterium P01_G01_bin.54]
MTQDAIAEFAHILEFTAGEFRLFVVRCNSVPWRDRLLTELAAICPLQLKTLTVAPTETQLYDRIQTEIANPPPPGVLMVAGLENNQYLDQLLDRANRERDKYVQNLAFPLVLWVSDRIHTQLLREAADLQSIGETLEFEVPSEFWAEWITQRAIQDLEAILIQGATRFLPLLATQQETNLAAELQVAAEALTAADGQTRAYLFFLKGRSRGYQDLTAKDAYGRSLALWPEAGNQQYRAIVHYSFGDWWRAQTKLQRRQAAAAWQQACEQFTQCVALLREPNPPYQGGQGGSTHSASNPPTSPQAQDSEIPPASPSPLVRGSTPQNPPYQGGQGGSTHSTSNPPTSPQAQDPEIPPASPSPFVRGSTPQNPPYQGGQGGLNPLDSQDSAIPPASPSPFVRGSNAEAGQEGLLARFINALGDALLATQQWDELATLAQEALELHQTHPDPFKQARAYGFLAEVALAREDWRAAQQQTEAALQTLPKQETPTEPDFTYIQAFNRAAYRWTLAKAQRGQGQATQSLTTLEDALKETRPQYELDLYVQILRDLQRGYWARRDYVQAYRYKRQRRDVETEFGLRAFLGAGRIRPQQQEQLPGQGAQRKVALEIEVSGRLTDVERLLERVGDTGSKVTVLYGPSGVGKSSLVTGGLMPRLWDYRVGTESERVLPLYLRTYQDWLGVLAQTVMAALEELDLDPSPASSGTQIRLLDSPLTKGAATAGDRAIPPNAAAIIAELRNCIEQRRLRPVLVLDQFEEFFFVYPDRPERDAFFEFLGQCLSLLPFKVIFTIRVEYIYQLLSRPGLDCIDGEILSNKVRYYLNYFSLEQAQTVVEDLTQRTQLDWQPGLQAAMITDLAQGYPLLQPIELQIVGAQMQQEGIETVAQYEQAGSKDALVQRYFTGVIRDCGPENEQVAGLVLFGLTNEQGQRPLKTGMELAELVAQVGQLGQLGDVLAILEMSGLVVEVEDKPTRYQLVHDYLVRPIRGWYDQGLRQKVKVLELENRAAKLRQAKTQQRVVIGSVIVAVVFAVLGIFSTSVSLQARREQRRAEHAETRSLIRQLALQAEAVRERSPFTYDLIGLLTVESASLSVNAEIPILETDLMLRESLQTFPEPIARIDHDSRVVAVAWSPDSKQVATASSDGTAKIVAVETGAEIARIDHDSTVLAVAWSPDGEQVATASDDGTAKIVAVETGAEIARIDHDNWVLAVAWSPDGEQVATASSDGTAKIVAVETGAEIARIDHDSTVWAVAW